MFHDLDATLKALLEAPDAPAPVRGATVSFVTPERGVELKGLTINLYLYEVKENRSLRDPVPMTQLTSSGFTRRQPPLRVDCTYLVTAWSDQTGSTKVTQEHELLGLALAWLSRFAEIPRDRLRGELAGNAPAPPTFVEQDQPLPTMIAQADGKPNMGEFWTALGQPPRPCFTLTITVALDLAQPAGEEGPLVTEKVIELIPMGAP